MSREQKQEKQLTLLSPKEFRSLRDINGGEVSRLVGMLTDQNSRDYDFSRELQWDKLERKPIKSGVNLAVVSENEDVRKVSIYHLLKDSEYRSNICEGLLIVEVSKGGSDVMPPVEITLPKGNPSEVEVNFPSTRDEGSRRVSLGRDDSVKLLSLTQKEVRQLKVALKPLIK